MSTPNAAEAARSTALLLELARGSAAHKAPAAAGQLAKAMKGKPAK